MANEKPREAGSGSFCIPRAAINALIEAKAGVGTIGAYLTLAAGTEKTGVYSTWSESAIRDRTKMRRDRVRKAVDTLKSIKVRVAVPGKKAASQFVPLVISRDDWIASNKGATLPDGDTPRAQVQHVLPDFGEPLEKRIWIGRNLVDGVGGFDRPLETLKNAGNEAARLLILLYEKNDMEGYGGIPPDSSVWCRYEPVADDEQLHGARLIRSKNAGTVAGQDLLSKVWGHTSSNFWDAHDKAGGPGWRAIEALAASGFIYQMVVVMNRNPVKRTFVSGGEYGDIPDDAEPLYELDCLSQHGYKPTGEQGIGGITARTAGELGHSVATEGGRFDGTYAAIVPRGHGAMIAGIYRLRFRISNSKNAGVKAGWARIQQGNREALQFVEAVRRHYGLIHKADVS